MTVVAKLRMSVDEFVDSADSRQGRWELIDGEPIRMESERVEHLEVKSAALSALKRAIRRAGLTCQALPDAATVRISSNTAYEPDVLVRCGARLPRGTIEIPDPLVVVEVLSPGSAARDYGEKVDGYFSVASIQHYLILVPDQAEVVYCRRGRDEAVERRLAASGTLRLEPPGLTVGVAEFFGDEDGA